MPITRRGLLGLLSSSTFFLTVAPGRVLDLPSCLLNCHRCTFPQGVASGDPQPEAVMLWTRAVPATGSGNAVRLLLQLSTDSNFTTLLLQEEVHTNAGSDYTVRAYIDGLAPDTQYFYRFLGANESASRIGRTRTAPAPGQARKVNLAFASCQNYEQAYYGSWARMLAGRPERCRGRPHTFRAAPGRLHLRTLLGRSAWMAVRNRARSRRFRTV